MIDLRVTAETPSELHDQLLAILAGHGGATQPQAEANPTPAAPKASRKTKSGSDAGSASTATASETTAGTAESASTTASPAASPSTVPAAAQTSTAAATSSAEQSSAAAEPVTRDSVTKKCMELGQKAGPAVVQQVFAEFGGQKFTDIPEDKYVALSVRLDDLLAQPGA